MKGLVTGRIVYFVLDAIAAKGINARREMGDVVRTDLGPSVNEGDVLPAMVVRVLTDTPESSSVGAVNLKVMLDGSDIFWATAVRYAAGETDGPQNPPDQDQKPVTYPAGTWHWMFAEQSTRYAPDQNAIVSMIEAGLKASLPDEIALRGWVTSEVASAMSNARVSGPEIEAMLERLVTDRLRGVAGVPEAASVASRLDTALETAQNLLNQHGHQGAWVQLTSEIKRIIDSLKG